MWVEAKMKVKRARGPRPVVQDRQDEIAWRKLREIRAQGLFHTFVEDIVLIVSIAK